ncbi:hypothetical protein [Halomarina oriensis]|uniref:Uncharacterized protein n=1 Tax=Halomarina oriensis TaxID=671145 RepID=A0A6B0GKB9_9EURY|nr:hypothetical protein [Halomarina oriensis]MWG35302.1 hypothetical protein [Halomarina oriensis]
MDPLTAYSGLFLRIGLYLVVFWPTVGYYVYQDSKQRDASSPRLRGALYGFFGVAGLFVYLARRERTKETPSR